MLKTPDLLQGRRCLPKFNSTACLGIEILIICLDYFSKINTIFVQTPKRNRQN